MVVGLLGILKAGGAYLPLDPELSARAARLHAGGCRRAGADDAAGAAATGCRGWRRETATCVRLDADWPMIARQPATAPRHGSQPRGHPGLHDLHLGLDRHAEGRLVDARGACSNFLAAMQRRRCRCRRTTGAGSRPPIGFDIVGAGALPAAAARRLRRLASREPVQASRRRWRARRSTRDAARCTVCRRRRRCGSRCRRRRLKRALRGSRTALPC